MLRRDLAKMFLFGGISQLLLSLIVDKQSLNIRFQEIFTWGRRGGGVRTGKFGHPYHSYLKKAKAGYKLARDRGANGELWWQQVNWKHWEKEIVAS